MIKVILFLLAIFTFILQITTIDCNHNSIFIIVEAILFIGLSVISLFVKKLNNEIETVRIYIICIVIMLIMSLIISKLKCGRWIIPELENKEVKVGKELTNQNDTPFKPKKAAISELSGENITNDKKSSSSIEIKNENTNTNNININDNPQRHNLDKNDINKQENVLLNIELSKAQTSFQNNYDEYNVMCKNRMLGDVGKTYEKDIIEKTRNSIDRLIRIEEKFNNQKHIDQLIKIKSTII